jgi:ArsR family transcriptional regulator, arsenate/arsenite/antimonite-responsive transcriptional repressor
MSIRFREDRMPSPAAAVRRAQHLACCSVLEAPIDEDQAAELAQAFAALADPVRLRLFSMIAAAGGACSCDLIDPIGKSQPTVSHHTKVLADAGLITGIKAGRWVTWSVVPSHLDRLRGALAP